jgi:hypothetical protein
MNTRSWQHSTVRTGIALLGCAGLTLAGCSRNDSPTGGDGTSATVTATQTVTQPAGEPATPAPGTGQPSAPDESGDGTGDASCRNTPVTNPLTGDQPIPVRFAASPELTDSAFYYMPKDGTPDPCTPLSWVKLVGSNGQEGSGPATTTGSFRETVALFADGQLITDPVPILARRVDSVDRIDDSTVRVNYAFYTDAPAVVNESTPGSATFHWDGSQITVTDNTLPLEQNDRAETLDLTAL